MKPLHAYMTIEEGAVRLGRSTSTIWRWINAGQLSTYRVLGRTLLLTRGR